MMNSTFQRIVEEIAGEYGVDSATVLQEMDMAIREGYENAKTANDQNALLLWKMVPCQDEIPTAFEFVQYISQMLNEKRDGR